MPPLPPPPALGRQRIFERAWFSCSWAARVSSVALGARQTESSDGKMPFSLPSQMSMMALLSVYVIGSHLMPSFLYASSSALKTARRKKFCSFSLAKLMQSCATAGGG